jgi:hypothetical protein
MREICRRASCPGPPSARRRPARRRAPGRGHPSPGRELRSVYRKWKEPSRSSPLRERSSSTCALPA